MPLSLSDGPISVQQIFLSLTLFMTLFFSLSLYLTLSLFLHRNANIIPLCRVVSFSLSQIKLEKYGQRTFEKDMASILNT